MRSVSPARRSAALVVAATAGLSTTLLFTAAGTASATPVADISYSDAANHTVTVPATDCAVSWDVAGAAGGSAGGQPAGLGDEITETTSVLPGSTLLIQPGQVGSAGGVGGTSGSASSGGPGGTAAGGGGGASIVRTGSSTTSPVLVLAAGGGGAGTQGAGGDGGSDGSGFTSANTHGYTGGGAADDTTPGSAGVGDAGAPGTNGQNGSALLGGAGPAGAGGGGGGLFGGGSGASDGTDGSGGGGGGSKAPVNEMNAGHTDADPTWVTASGAAGFVHGTWVPCTAPSGYLPGEVTGDSGDGAVSVHVRNDQLQSAGDPRAARWTGWEITTDGGAHWASVANGSAYGGPDFTAVVAGLTNGHAYSVAVRPTSVVGPGEVSEALHLTPTHVAAAPTGFAATVSGARIHLSWSPPTGETGITAYQAWVLPGDDPQSNSGEVDCAPMDASARSCDVTVAPGIRYTAGVAAVTDARGSQANVVTEVIPALAAPPSGVGAVTGAHGESLANLVAGRSVTLAGSGYQPFSTVSLYVYSTPTLLGTVTADAAGSFSQAVTLPAGLAPGAHHLVAAGVDPSGNVRYLRTDVTVATPSNQLAWTGFETLPFVGVGAAAVALGTGLVLLGRRRRTS